MAQIKFNELPFDEFQKIGLSKEFLMKSMDKRTLEYLLRGKRTPLLEGLEYKMGGEIKKFDGKLSVKEVNGRVSLHIHPKFKNINNDLGLKAEEIKMLVNNQIINKNVNGEMHLLQLDKETNEILRVKQKNINIPLIIEGINITQEQKNKLKQGNSIELTKGKEKHTVKLNFNSDKGIEIKSDFEQKQKEKYDFEHPEFKGVLKTDRNNQEFHISQKSSFKM